MPPNPDIVFIGDSHLPALTAGAQALGLNYEAVQFSGRLWHMGKVRYGAKGLWAPRKFAGFAEMARIKEHYQLEDVVQINAPIVTTVGFHLGALTSPLGWMGHVGFGADRPIEENNIVLSSQFIDLYIDQFRQKNFAVLQKWAEVSELLVIPPPKVRNVANFSLVRSKIIEKLRSLDLKVYDPASDFHDDDGNTPIELLESDHIHGNALYGQKLFEKIVERRLIDLKSICAPSSDARKATD